jgi:D-alanyl-D-alanine carboxypeptidase
MQTSNSWRFWWLARRLGLAFFLLLVCCISISCGNPCFSGENEQYIEQVLKNAMAENDVPGAIVGIWAPSRGTWVHAEGIADLTTGREIRPTDKFRIASITKTFTATVILQLVDEGKLSLEDNLNRWAPEFPYADEITVRQILNHTAGIYSLTEDEDFDESLLDNPLRKWTLQELLDIAIEHEPYFFPGEGWHYSAQDTSYWVLSSRGFGHHLR